MAYSGMSVSIPLGQLGLQTDDPMNQLPPNAAITANNISLFASRIEKAYGSQPYQSMAALSAGVVGIWDWLPSPTVQRMIAATSDGKIWKDTGDGTFSTATPLGTGFGALDPNTQFVAGGAEQANRNKKLFISTSGINQIQVISGDGGALTNIQNPNIDWAQGNYPTFGFIFNGRHFVFGCANNRHTIYWSGAANTSAPTFTADESSSVNPTHLINVNSFAGLMAGMPITGTGIPGSTTIVSLLYATNTVVISNASIATNTTVTFTAGPQVYQGQDHENFITPATNSGAASAGFSTVFSGEGDGIISAFVYKGVAMLFKRPFGVYILNFTDSTNFTVSKYSDAFGISSPHGACQVVDDLMAGNNSNSLTSLKATLAFGSFETGDVLLNARVRNYVRTNTDPSGLQFQHAIYYPEKQVAYFSTRQSASSTVQDQMIVVDCSRQSTRITLEPKDKPTCLATRKDANNVPRPMYGSGDGRVYLMDQSTYSVNGAAYTGEFQTPYIDFSYLDASFADKVKQFDFITLSYISVGAWSFYLDYYVDGSFVETIPFAMSNASALGSFVLDVSRLGSSTPQKYRMPLRAAGRSISFRIYNSNVSQFFKVDNMIVSFRMSAEQNRSSKG